MSSALETQSLAGKPKNNALLSPLAGKAASHEMRVDVGRLESEYFRREPDVKPCLKPKSESRLARPWDFDGEDK